MVSPDDCACSGKGRSTQIALCPDQVVVFDLEYGQPAASTTLPTSRPAFRDLLGCFGHADAGKRVLESGVDLLYTSHQVTTLLSLENFLCTQCPWRAQKFSHAANSAIVHRGSVHQRGNTLVRCAVCICHHPFWLVCCLQQGCHGSCEAACRTKVFHVLPPSLYE